MSERIPFRQAVALVSPLSMRDAKSILRYALDTGLIPKRDVVYNGHNGRTLVVDRDAWLNLFKVEQAG